MADATTFNVAFCSGVLRQAAMAVAVLGMLGCSGVASSGGGGVTDGGLADRWAGAESGADAGPSDAGADSGFDDSPSSGAAPCVPSPQIHGNLEPLWSTTLGPGISTPVVAVDSANDIVVVGSADGPMAVDGKTFTAGTAAGGLTPFILKLDPSGKLLWSRVIDGESIVGAAAVDPSGNIFVTGGIDANATPRPDFGTGPLPGSFYLVKLDPQGQTLWAYSAACSEVSDTLSVAVDGAGNVAVAGLAGDPACFVGGSDASFTAQWTPFVTEFDPSGNVKYSQFSAVPLSPVVQFDPAGNLLVAGSVHGKLDGTPLADPNATTAVAEKLDPNGNVLWRIGDGAYSTATAIAASVSGAVIAGTFSGTIGLAQPTSARGPLDVFFAGLDDAGAPTFERGIPNAGLSIGDLMADPTGGTVGAGWLLSYGDFGNGLLAPPGIAVAKVDAQGNVLYGARFAVTGTGDDGAPPSVAVDRGGNVVLGVTFSGAADLGSGILSAPATWRQALAIARYAPAAPMLGAPRPACPIPTDAGLPEGGTLVATVPVIPTSSPRSFWPGDLALSADTAYWTTSGEVMAVPLAGGDPAPLAIAQNYPGPLVLDSNTLYWTNGSSFELGFAPSTGSVVSLALDGGTPTTLASGQDHPGAIAVDATRVYYFAGGILEDDGGATPVNLFSVPRDGTMPTTPTTVLSGLSSSGPLAVNGGTIAFATSSRSTGTLTTQIATVPATGGAITTLATSDRAVKAIAIDATNVYWVDSRTAYPESGTVAADGQVRSVPLSGGAITLVADNQAAPGELVLLGPTLFWSNGGTNTNGVSSGNTGLWSVPAGGGTPSGVVTGLWSLGTFGVDPTHIAWFGLADTGVNAPLGLFVKDR